MSNNNNPLFLFLLIEYIYICKSKYINIKNNNIQNKKHSYINNIK